MDLSRPEDPRIVGEVKVSGFSSYLHLYGDGLLLGIGSEADEDTGRETGAKISMFDISEPGQMTELDRVGMKDISLWNISDYRSLLVEPEKNLIGFSTDGGRKEKRKPFTIFTAGKRTKALWSCCPMRFPRRTAQIFLASEDSTQAVAFMWSVSGRSQHLTWRTGFLSRGHFLSILLRSSKNSFQAAGNMV